MSWKHYNPTWLVELALEQHPDKLWLADALAECKWAMARSEAYICFVNNLNPNKPGAEWQFEENIVLEHPEQGDLVLDILMDNRVGGVEFLSKL